MTQLGRERQYYFVSPLRRASYAGDQELRHQQERGFVVGDYYFISGGSGDRELTTHRGDRRLRNEYMAGAGEPGTAARHRELKVSDYVPDQAVLPTSPRTQRRCVLASVLGCGMQ